MDKFSSITSNIYALLLVIGGIMGFVRAHSLISLIMGLIFGFLIFISTNFGLHNPKMQYFSNLLIALIMTIVFWIRFNATHSFMPSGLLLILSSVIVVVVGIGYMRNKD